MKKIHVPQALTDHLVQPKQWKLAMRFGTWNVRSMYRPVSLTTLARELARYKLGFVGVQEVRWAREGTVRARRLYVFLLKRKRKSLIVNRIFCTPHNSISC